MSVFDRPLFIIAAPRSGSTLLFELLATHPAFWTVGGESHGQIERIASLHPAQRGWTSNRLASADATPDVALQLKQNFLSSLTYADGTPPDAPREAGLATARLLEKTPKNALRIPFLKAIFPDAKFIFLHREARSNISSIIEAWRSGRFVTYPDLPGWVGLPWSLLLLPGWRELIGATPAEIALHQWRTPNEIALDDLHALPKTDWCALSYEDMLENPLGTAAQLCRFADVPFAFFTEQPAQTPLPYSRYTLTPPMPEKWRRHTHELMQVLPATEAMSRRLQSMRAPL